MEDDALKIIDELNFEELHNIKKDYKNNEFFLIGKIKGRDVFLKISNKKNKTRMDQFRREELVDQILEKHNKDIKKPLVVKTDIFGFGENKNYVWVARKFYPGQTLAPFNPGKTLFGYDLIRPSFLLSREKIMKKIIENIEAIYSLETDFRKLAISHSEFPRRYKSNLLEYNIKTIKEELGLDLKKSVEYFARVKNEYFDKKNIRANVGDLSPANIIIKKDGELIFSDFELFCFDNYTVDVAYLYLFLWRYKKWQQELLNLTITNDESRKYFRASIIRILMHLHKWPYLSLKKKEGINSKEFNRRYIWTRYLAAANESFEAIMNVK